MALTKVSGIVSAVRQHVELKTDANKQVSQKDSVSFRIGNRPASLGLRANINEGDRVTAVGDDFAEMGVLILRNDSTNIVYTTNNGPFLTALGWFCLVLSTPVLFILLGVPIGNETLRMVFGLLALCSVFFIPISIYLLLKGRKFKQATAMLNSSP